MTDEDAVLALYDRGAGRKEIAERLCVDYDTVLDIIREYRALARLPKRVAVDVFTEHLRRCPLTYSQIARGMGWMKPKDGRLKPDSQRVRRTLGLVPWSTGRYQQRVNRDTALKLAAVMGLDPIDIGQ